MDTQECKVFEYLKSSGFKETEIVFEPDGNVTPDFLVKHEIAIEVRRLNQHSEKSDKRIGLEVESIPLYQSVSKVLDEFNGLIVGKTYLIFLRYSRPLPNRKKIKQLARKVLKEFCENPSKNSEEIETEHNITFILIPVKHVEGTSFRMLGDSDDDSSGWLLEKMQNNIQHCSDEKTKKISPHRYKYKTWWLVLVDHIGYGLNEFERELFYDQVKIHHNWDKLIIIPPSKKLPAIEI